MRFFNTEGPVRADLHYRLPPLQRWDLDEVLRLIAQQKYFLLHAPRQTGKTSCLLALLEHLNREGRYGAVYVREPRVRRVIEPVLAGASLSGVPADDIQFLIDLGLLRMAPGAGLLPRGECGPGRTPSVADGRGA